MGRLSFRVVTQESEVTVLIQHLGQVLIGMEHLQIEACIDMRRRDGAGSHWHFGSICCWGIIYAEGH